MRPFVFCQSSQPVIQSVTLDGKLEEEFWKSYNIYLVEATHSEGVGVHIPYVAEGNSHLCLFVCFFFFALPCFDLV
jgi:hypothetical protein